MRATADHAIAAWPPEAWVNLYSLEWDRPEYFATCQVWDIPYVLGEDHEPAEFGVVLNTEQPEQPTEQPCLP